MSQGHPEHWLPRPSLRRAPCSTGKTCHRDGCCCHRRPPQALLAGDDGTHRPQARVRHAVWQGLHEQEQAASMAEPRLRAGGLSVQPVFGERPNLLLRLGPWDLAKKRRPSAPLVVGVELQVRVLLDSPRSHECGRPSSQRVPVAGGPQPLEDHQLARHIDPTFEVAVRRHRPRAAAQPFQ